MIEKVQSLIKKYGGVNETVREEYKKWIKEKKSILSGGESAYTLIDDNGKIYQPVSMAAPDKPETRSHRPLLHPITHKPCPVPVKGWRFTDDKLDELLRVGKIEFGIDESVQPRQKYFLEDNMTEAVSSLLYYGGSDDAMGLPFDNPKPIYVAKRLIKSICKQNTIILDFFSGSATTAHAVMQLNAEDGGNRKFIMVQLPEKCDEKSEAYKAGYKTICEIGKERIRRAGKKIKEETGKTDLDTGFRVLKLDSSNMQDVFYNPAAMTQDLLATTIDNVKPDRTPMDLLFQVMLELGVQLSAKIEEKEICGKKYYVVNENEIIACFDDNLNNDVITEIAKQKPLYAVFKDKSFATDSVGINNEQLFKTYSPTTDVKVI
mgnify:FL=1